MCFSEDVAAGWRAPCRGAGWHQGTRWQLLGSVFQWERLQLGVGGRRASGGKTRSDLDALVPVEVKGFLVDGLQVARAEEWDNPGVVDLDDHITVGKKMT